MKIKSIEKSNIVYGFLFILPIVSYLYTIIKFSKNMPWWDDYSAVLGFINNFITHKNDLVYILNILFKEHYDHRIVFDRIITLIDYFTFESINFVILGIIGDLGLFAIFGFMMYLAFNKNLKLKELIPIPFFIFSLSQFGLVSWSMASIQQYWQLFFSIISLYFVAKDEELTLKNIIYSFFFGLLGSFTGGGGLIVFILIFIYIAFYKKHKTYLFVWSILSMFVYLLYFVILKYGLERRYAQSVSKDSINSILYAIQHPIPSIEYILTFLIGINGGRIFPISIVLGFGLLVLSLYVIFKSPKDIISLIISFILSTAIVASLFRVGCGKMGQCGVTEAASTRYAEYPNLLFSCLYIYFMSSLSISKYKKMFYWFSTFVGVSLFFLWLIVGSIILEYRVKMLKTGMVCINNHNSCVNTLKESMKLHTFIPPVDIDKISKNVYNLNTVNPQIRKHLINTLKQKLKSL